MTCMENPQEGAVKELETLRRSDGGRGRWPKGQVRPCFEDEGDLTMARKPERFRFSFSL